MRLQTQRRARNFYCGDTCPSCRLRCEQPEPWLDPLPFDGGRPEPASRSSGTSPSRRRFLKAVGAASVALAAVPFIPQGDFLIPPRTFKIERKRIATVNDLTENSSLIFYYPTDTDPEYTNLLIHLSPEKAREAGREFVAFNRTCIHLRCLVSYLPSSEVIGCPCHGSVYRPTDGWPIAGPAAFIGRYLPEVKLEIDGDGNIYATDLSLGEIGYGRER